MKIKFLFFVFFVLISTMALCQEKPEIINATEIIKKGLAYYEDEKYEDALIEFKKISENDTAYYTSVVEQILCYYQLKKYEEGIAIGEKALSLKLYISSELFIDMGACYDNLEKYDEAIKLYDEAIKLFPKNNFLLFNKAYTLSKMGKNKEALEYYMKSAEMNPFHSRTHYALGAIAWDEGKTTLAMLAFNTFILLNSTTDLANKALVSINEMATTKYTENTNPKNIDITDGDDYSDIDLLIQNYVALDKKYKVKSVLKYPFIKQDYLIFEKLPENIEEKGFWYKMYVPFYKQLLKENKFDLFANYILIASANEAHKKIVEKNKSKLTTFNEWIKTTWDDLHRTSEMEFNGKKQKVSVFRTNNFYAISAIGTLNDSKTLLNGYAEFYHDNGKLKGFGKFDSEGKKDGEWTWLYENGNIKSKEKYNNGNLSFLEWHSFLGIIQSKIPYKNEKINGEGYTYTSTGAKNALITLKDDIKEGNYEEYYLNGQISLKGSNSNGNYNGKIKTYYDSGELKSEVNYLDGKKDAQQIYYYRDGKIKQKEYYLKGKLQGDLVSYYENGKTCDSLKYLDDKPIGKSITYFKNGNMSILSDFDESGKYNGIYKEFDSDGKIYYELEYKKGEIIGYKYYNKKGDIIKQDKKKSGSFDLENYHSNGIIQSRGKYEKENKQGKWSFYDINGNISSELSYNDNKPQGESKTYFANGKIDNIIQYKDGKANDYYIGYFDNGNIYNHGNYKDDRLEGEWITYNPNRTIAAENYYIDGLFNGIQKYYAINGQLVESKTYYKDVMLNTISYDTLGNVIDSIELTNAGGKIIYHFYKGGPVRSEHNLLYNEFVDEVTYFYPNGEIRTKGQYFNGKKNGIWTWYHWNGNISSKGKYEYGELAGIWEYYTEDGKLYNTTEYENGNINGKEVYYYEDGKIEKNYVDDLLEGTSYYYTPDGQLEHKRQYLHNQLISYTYFESNGKEKTIEVENETADIKIYFKSGKIAREYSIIKGLYQGSFKRYYPTGQLYETRTYKDDNINGELLIYHANGNIKEKKNYIDGKLNGVLEKYYANGNLQETSNYIYGTQHGKCRKYDKTGKITTLLTYYDDNVVSINNNFK